MLFLPFPLPFVSKSCNAATYTQALMLLFLKSCFPEAYHLHFSRHSSWLKHIILLIRLSELRLIFLSWACLSSHVFDISCLFRRSGLLPIKTFKSLSPSSDWITSDLNFHYACFTEAFWFILFGFHSGQEIWFFFYLKVAFYLLLMSCVKLQGLSQGGSRSDITTMSLRKIKMFSIFKKFSVYSSPSFILVEPDANMVVTSNILMSLATHWPMHGLHGRVFKFKCFQNKFFERFLPAQIKKSKYRHWTSILNSAYWS